MHDAIDMEDAERRIRQRVAVGSRTRRLWKQKIDEKKLRYGHNSDTNYVEPKPK